MDLARKEITQTEYMLNKLDDYTECGFYVDSLYLPANKSFVEHCLQKRIQCLKKYQNQLLNLIKNQ